MTDNADLNARRLAATPRGVATMTPIFADHAENAELWDVEGRRYIDFAGGIAVLNTGHRNPRVMARVEAQLQRFTHTAYQVVPYDSYIELAERLNALAPGKTPKKTLFVSTGAEAVENAVKIAKVHTGRSGVFAFNGSFHGRTLMTMGLTGKVAPYKAGFGPFPGDIYHIPFPIAAHDISQETSLTALDNLFKTTIEASRVAAIIIEPVQGEGGFYIAPFDFLEKIRAICDQHGIVMIADEVQTGFGRTGRLFAMEHSGVEPDLMTIAKSLAGGFPLSGVIGKAEIMDAPGPGGLGGTYGGNPLGCAAALGVLECIEQDDLLQRSRDLGQHLLQRIQQIAGRSDIAPIGDIRGLGAMVAFEMVTGKGSSEPDPVATRALCATALKNGLILLSCGAYGNTIRILVPLTATDALVDEGMDVIEASLVELASKGRAA